MTPTLLENPSVEPVSLAEMKAWLRIDQPDEDDLLGRVIAAARLTVEAASGLRLIAQRWRVALDRWPRDAIVRLPLRPLITCDAVRVFSAPGVGVTLAPANYMLDRASAPPRLVMLAPPPAPGILASGIEIDVTAGFGATADHTPEALRQAVRLVAARWWERRGDDLGDTGDALLTSDLRALVDPYRDARL